MHNLTKVKLFRILLCFTYPLAVLFVYPFVMLKKRHTGKLFFFFDRYVIGGAQRVHIDILHSVKDEPKQVYFTRLSPNDVLKKEFYNIPFSENRDIHFWCDNLLFRLFTVHYYAFYINQHKRAHVFSSNSTFFYDMLFFLKKDVIKTELLHNFTMGKRGMEYFGLGNYQYLDNRMVIDKATKHNIINQYKEYGVPKKYNTRVHLIEPGVMIPENVEKPTGLPLKVLYAGRGGAQKRIPLLDAIASYFIKQKMPVEFHFAGSMMDELSAFVKEHSVIHGEISRQEDMYQLYKNTDVILMTSAYEGFPMLIKEGMACGCIPVVTALDGNRSHLADGENALLLKEPEKEQQVIANGIAAINRLSTDSSLRIRLSKSAYAYSTIHFNKEQFTRFYREFLLVEPFS